MKWWSELHVSEDLELSLRLQIAGWRVRYVTYCGDGFQEGVSFTVYDELRRWRKHCYGSVRSISMRLTKGGTCLSSSQKMAGTWAFNSSLYCVPQIRYRIGRKIYSHRIPGNILYLPCGLKLSLDTAASGWIYLLVNYLVGGWFPNRTIQYYIDNLITIASVVIMMYPFVYAIYRYYWKRDSFSTALVENSTRTVMFVVFFGGLSTHISWALLCHLLSIDMQWDATPKVICFTISKRLTTRNRNGPSPGGNCGRLFGVSKGCMLP